jgi:hypothetical protein
MSDVIREALDLLITIPVDLFPIADMAQHGLGPSPPPVGCDGIFRNIGEIEFVECETCYIEEPHGNLDGRSTSVRSGFGRICAFGYFAELTRTEKKKRKP